MSFYGGRPGQSFTITRVFKNFVEMYEEAQSSQSSLISELYNDGRVPVGSFVLIAYGMGSQATFAESMGEVTEQNSAYKQNRQEEIDWFNSPNCPVQTIRPAADVNATVWWDIPWSASNDYNGSVWVKCYDSSAKTHYYAYVANIAGIFPEIANGQWIIGGVETGIQAEGRQVEFQAFYDENLASYAFLTYTPEEDVVAIENEAEDDIEEPSEEEKRPAQFGLANLADRFTFNVVTDSYEPNEDGEFILVYEADKFGRYQYNENGEWKELGYFTLQDWDFINYPKETNFTSDSLKWRYKDEENWHDLFDITDLTNIKTYMLSSLEASQSSEKLKNEIEEIKVIIDETKESINETADITSDWLAQAQGAANNAEVAVAELKEIIDNLPPDAQLTDLEYLAGLINEAKGKFATIDNRLDAMPYQFNLIKDMRSCTSLERGDKVFTFGKDEVGDDDSKLFQIFDPDNYEEDKARLEEVDEALISVYNPNGLKIDETYKIGTTGLIAGKLTVFSGKGSGGGGGGTIPTLSSSLTSVTVQSGQTVTIDWYWTSANGGNGTIFIKDSMSNAPIVDVADKSKNYTMGVVSKRGANESFVWKPTDGIHKLSMYVVDGGGIPTNNIEIDVIVGGLSCTSSTPTDGQSYSTDAVINLSYKFSTIYKTDKVVLHYDIYNNNVLRPDLSGEKESDFASGSQSISVTLKTRDKDIGVGVFKIVAYAFMKNSPDVITNQMTKNFIIAEVNKIYLTTSFDASQGIYANKTFYIPLILTYGGGSSFTIEGKYSTQSGFDYESGTKLETMAEDVSAGKQIQFPVSFNQPGTYYLKFFASGTGINATGESEEIVVEVGEENKQYVLQKPSHLLLNLSADEGQTNKNNRNTWKNTVVSAGNDSNNYFCDLMDFNYYANGWSTHSGGIPEGWLLFNSKAYGLIKADLFKSIPSTGFTLECVFKVNDIGVDAPILDWTMGSSGRGIYIYKDRAIINISEVSVNDLTVYYEPHGISANNEAIHIAFVFDAVNQYAKIYLNGVLSAASALTYNTFTDGSYRNYNTIFLNQNNKINVSGATSEIINGNCKIGAIRLYSDVLTSDEIVKNYIYNLQDPVLQRSLWSRAGFISQEDEEVLTAPTDGSVPYMKFYLKRSDWNRMTKDDKVPVTIKYYEKGSTTPITWYNTKTSWQGTSSIAYPVKNFKIKLQKDLEGNKQKYKLDKDYGKKENTFCLKADYMDSSHIHNTGNANFIHNTGLFSKYTLTAAQASECGLRPDEKWVLPKNKPAKSLASRTTIYGYPILLYICLESEDESIGGTAALTDEEVAAKDPICIELKKELETLSPSDENYAAKKAEYDLAVAQYAVENRVYEPDKFWGIYNFNLDKGSNDSWGLQRTDEYENYDFSDCTSFEIAANSAYSGGGFRCLKFVKKNNAEEYAWTRPYVYADLDGNINMDNDTYWLITRCNSDGKLNNSTLTLKDNYNGKSYTCYQNVALDITGYVEDGVRYVQSDDGKYTADPSGKWALLYEMDPVSFKLKLDDKNNLIPFKKYYELTSDWKTEIKVSYTEVVKRSEWSIVDTLPENKEYYYDYYITDLELRFPDMDKYLFNKDGKTYYNKLFYKEYDKIIALVDYVDSYRNATQVINGTTFLNTLSDHFEKDGLMNYYLFVIAVGLIDNFGKNMMMDTWGFDKNHQRPYRTTEINGITYHQVYHYLGTWDEDEEYYTGTDDFEYGLLDFTNGFIDENGIKKFNIYPCDSSYTTPDLTAEPIQVSISQGIGEELIWNDVVSDDLKIGWIHEIHEDKLIWCPHCYDLDSCLSYDNSGNIVFTPSIEMEDTTYILATDETQEVDKAPFNTSSSSLWKKVANGMREELTIRYKELQKEILTEDNFYESYYTNAIDTLGQRWYNADATPKYLSRQSIKVIINNQVDYLAPIEYINLSRGTDWQRTYKWLKHRLAYIGSMCDRDNSEGYAGGLEPRGSEEKVTYSFSVNIYQPMYMKIVGKNNQVSWVRSKRYNDTVVLTAPSTNDASDQEMYILPATNIKSIKERHGYGYSTFKQNGASRLLSVDLSGSSALKAWNKYIPKNEADAEYEASKEVVVTKPENNLIQSINVRGCSALTGNTAVINGADYPLLRSIDIRDSGAKFNFNNGTSDTDEGGGILTEALLNDKVTTLNIKNHFELEKVLIQLKYDENIDESIKVQSGHSTEISSVILKNCPKIKLDFQYQIKNGSNYISPSGGEPKTINQFIEDFGQFALFQNINNFVISNALAINDNVGEKELKLSLSKADLIHVTNCNINKITFVAGEYKLNGIDLYASYPGTGGSPTRDDSSYQAANDDGLCCDMNITTVEIRRNPKENVDFNFPWRVHLGTLTNLEKFIVNTGKIKPKEYDISIFSNDSEKLGITSDNSIPKRFELILPDSNNNPNFNEFTVIKQGETNPEIHFTAIKQPGVDYSALNQDRLLQNYVNGIQYFSGVDLRGYSGLVINFNGFKNITGILGMDSINVSMIPSENFKEYFANCNNLEEFYSYENGKNKLWDFSAWATGTNARTFTSLYHMFYNCKKLKDDYISGWSKLRAINLIDASYMFENCELLEKIEGWMWDVPKLETTEGMFNNCKIGSEDKVTGGLEKVNIKFINANYLTNISKMFNNCSALIHNIGEEFPITIYNPEGYFDTSKVEKMDGLFTNCYQITGVSFERVVDEQDWDFSSLKSMSYMFSSCKSLVEVKFPDKANFSNVTNMSYMFSNCSKLKKVFTNGTGKEVILYDPEKGTKNSLTLSRMFEKCEELDDIGSFALLDMSRVSDFSYLFYQAKKLKGSTNAGGIENNILNLSQWITSENLPSDSKKPMEKNFSAMFSNCYSLEGISFPEIKNITSIYELFANCLQLKTIDISPLGLTTIVNGNIINDNGVESLSKVFQNCTNLTTIIGYQNWDVSNVSTFESLFDGCGKLSSLNLKKWKLSSKATTLTNMFKGCSSLEWIYGLRELVGTSDSYKKNPVILTNVIGMFHGCQALKLGRDDEPDYDNIQCDLRYWDYALSGVSSFENMFNYCEQIKSVFKIFSFGETSINTTSPYVGCYKNFENLTSFEGMFENCTSLEYASYFMDNFTMKKGKLTSLKNMFNGCSVLREVKFQPTNGDFTKLHATGLNGFVDNCDVLEYFVLTQDNSLKCTLYLSTLGTKEGSIFKNRSAWDNLFNNSLKGTCYNFKPTDNYKPDAPNTDILEGFVDLPSESSVPAAHESFETSYLAQQMNWSSK